MARLPKINPYLEYQIVFQKWICSVGQLLGLDIFDKNYKISFANLLLLAFKSIAFLSYFWTMYAYSTDMVVKAAGHCGVCFQALISPVFVVLGRAELKRLFEFLDRIYKQNQGVDDQLSLLVYFTNILKIFIQWMLTIFAGSTVLFLTAPVTFYVLLGTAEELLPSFIPGVAPFEIFGYLLHYLYHAAVFCVSQLLLLYANGLFTILHLHVILLTSIIRSKIAHLNKINEDMDMTEMDRKIHFRNILMLHNDTITFVNDLAALYGLPIFVIIYLSVQDVVLHIFAFFVINWIPPGSPLVILLELGTVAFLCSIGTIFEVVYDRTYDDIITINWYLLPRKCQKELIILTQAAMKPHSLSIGGLFPLNIDTFVHIIKGMYSLVMVLRQFV